MITQLTMKAYSVMGLLFLCAFGASQYQSSEGRPQDRSVLLSKLAKQDDQAPVESETEGSLSNVNMGDNMLLNNKLSKIDGAMGTDRNSQEDWEDESLSEHDFEPDKRQNQIPQSFGKDSFEEITKVVGNKQVNLNGDLPQVSSALNHVPQSRESWQDTNQESRTYQNSNQKQVNQGSQIPYRLGEESVSDQSQQTDYSQKTQYNQERQPQSNEGQSFERQNSIFDQTDQGQPQYGERLLRPNQLPQNDPLSQNSFDQSAYNQGEQSLFEPKVESQNNLGQQNQDFPVENSQYHQGEQSQIASSEQIQSQREQVQQNQFLPGQVPQTNRVLQNPVASNQQLQASKDQQLQPIQGQENQFLPGLYQDDRGGQSLLSKNTGAGGSDNLGLYEPQGTKDQDMLNDPTGLKQKQLNLEQDTEPSSQGDYYSSQNEEDDMEKAGLQQVYDGEEEEEERQKKDEEEEEPKVINIETDMEDMSHQQEYNEGKMHESKVYDSQPTESSPLSSPDLSSKMEGLEEEDEKDDWYDDPNTYDEDKNSYAYGDEKSEEHVVKSDSDADALDNDDWDKAADNYQGDGDVFEDVVDSEMVKKDKQPTAPSSMVLFYTWMIVAVLIMVVTISTYQTRCKGLRSQVSKKVTHTDDRKRLLDHEFT